MCISEKDSEKDLQLIKIRDKTEKGKYEILKSYYTSWNTITKPSHRAIVDTHAGTGLVKFEPEGRRFLRFKKKTLYGSAALALLKTLALSMNLKIILNEKKKTHYETLKGVVEQIKTEGFTCFQRKSKKQKQKYLNSKRSKKVKQKKVVKYPKTPNQGCPRNYFPIKIRTKADVILYNKPIKAIISHILNEDLKDIPKKNGAESSEAIKIKTIFFVDPCGKVKWFVIEKIGKKANKTEGIELILNWSYDAIRRNSSLPHFHRILSEIYGIPIEKIPIEFERVSTMEQYYEKYKNQLTNYWNFVEAISVPRKIKPKKSLHKSYYLIYCTNNKSGLSLIKSKMKKVKKGLRDDQTEIDDYF